jgi:hypothetical protein
MGKRPAEDELFEGKHGLYPKRDQDFYAKRR